MPMWGNADQTGKSPIYAPSQVNKAPNTTNRDALFGNNTTVGVFGVDAQEEAASAGIAHPGWILRTVGSGGRAGRVFNETLVAMGSMTGDASDDATLPDNVITITAQPANANVTAPAAATFSVTATSTPGGTPTYQWQLSTGGAYANIAAAGVYSNVTTATLSISNSTGLTGNKYRVLVGGSSANTKTSNAGTLTVN